MAIDVSFGPFDFFSRLSLRRLNMSCKYRTFRLFLSKRTWILIIFIFVRAFITFLGVFTAESYHVWKSEFREFWPINLAFWSISGIDIFDTTYHDIYKINLKYVNVCVFKLEMAASNDRYRHYVNAGINFTNKIWRDVFLLRHPKWALGMPHPEPNLF